MKSLGFGDHSRKGFQGEGGFELVLERWVLGRGGRGKRAHSRPRRSMGKFVATIWGRGRWWILEEGRPVAKYWEQVAGSGVKFRISL